MNDILRAVADVGFPIVYSLVTCALFQQVIAVYPETSSGQVLLMVFGKKLDRLSDAVEKLSRYVEGLGKRDSPPGL